MSSFLLPWSARGSCDILATCERCLEGRKERTLVLIGMTEYFLIIPYRIPGQSAAKKYEKAENM
jgi:hypothetical protein